MAEIIAEPFAGGPTANLLFENVDQHRHNLAGWSCSVCSPPVPTVGQAPASLRVRPAHAASAASVQVTRAVESRSLAVADRLGFAKYDASVVFFRCPHEPLWRAPPGQNRFWHSEHIHRVRVTQPYL